MARHLTEVIDHMIKIIPDSEKGLIAALSDHKSSAQFASPELQLMWWEEVAVTLRDRFGSQSKLNEWEQEVLSVWIG